MIKLTAVAAAAVLATAGLARAAYPPTSSAPSTYPPTVAARQADALVPATPAAPPATAQPAASTGPKVQVFPFEPVGSAAGSEWVGKGIQSSLQSDVSRSGAMLVMSVAALGGDPVAAAKAAGATLAVTGTYQIEAGQVRADGHLIDTATGQPVGGFSGKAPIGSVFQLEDALGEQLRRLLPPERPAVGQQQQFTGNVAGGYRYDGTPMNNPEAQPPTDPTTVIVTPTPTVVQGSDYDTSPVVNNNYYTNAGYGGGYGGYGGYGYPYVGYSYPYYGGYYGGIYDPFVFGYYGGIGFYGNRGYYGHGYDYGHGHDHGYYGHGGRPFGVGGRAFGGDRLTPNPTFRNGRGTPNGGGYVLNHGTVAGGGRSFSPVAGGGRSFSPSAGGGGARGGFGGGGGGGFHGGGGGGGHR